MYASEPEPSGERKWKNQRKVKKKEILEVVILIRQATACVCARKANMLWNQIKCIFAI
jgi:hypothetical protein